MSQTIPTTMAATVRASNEGLDQVDKARCKKGWAKTEQVWADLATTSKATLRRFWGGLKIQTSAFQAICEAAGIEDWESIADFDSKDDAPPKTYDKRLSFAIAGSIEEIDKQKLDVIVALLRKLGGDAEIEILDIEEGSVKLTLGGSEEALQRLQELFDSGELKEVEGLLVQDVHLLTQKEIAESIRNTKSKHFSNGIIFNIIVINCLPEDVQFLMLDLSNRARLRGVSQFRIKIMIWRELIFLLYAIALIRLEDLFNSNPDGRKIDD